MINAHRQQGIRLPFARIAAEHGSLFCLGNNPCGASVDGRVRQQSSYEKFVSFSYEA